MASKTFEITYSVTQTSPEGEPESSKTVQGTQVLEIISPASDTTEVTDIFQEVEEAILSEVFGESS